MKIQVLGSGCLSCAKLYQAVNKAVAEMGLKTEVEYLTGMEGTKKMLAMGAMGGPVLAIDGQAAMIGLPADLEKIKGRIKEYLKK